MRMYEGVHVRVLLCIRVQRDTITDLSLLQKPKEGLAREGGLGLLKGIGQGLAGVVVKPVIGTVDLVAKTTEGIRNTTTYFDEKERRRVRLPRHFQVGMPLHPYSAHRAAGQYILKSINEAAYQKEPFAFCVRVEQPHQILWMVVSPQRIMSVATPRSQTSPLENDRVDQKEPKLLWNFPIGWLRAVNLDPTLCQVRLAFQNGPEPKQERVFPCESPAAMTHANERLHDFQESMRVTLQTIVMQPTGVPIAWNDPLNNARYEALKVKWEQDAQARQQQLLDGIIIFLKIKLSPTHDKKQTRANVQRNMILLNMNTYACTHTLSL